MKKYKYYNNTNGVVQSATRNSITNKVEVVVKVNSGQLGVSTSEVYPITFMAMDDTLFTGFSESCTYNASTDEYTLFFPGASISEETIAKFMYPSAEWELRVTQTELNELFNEVYQLTGNLVTTPEITGPDAPIVYQGTYANEYSFTASPTLAGNTISSFLVDVSGIGTQVITAADNAGTYTLKIPTTISAGTKLDMYVTATDSQGWKSSPAYKQLTVTAPYVKAPTVVKPTEGQEVIAINFDIQSSTFATEGLEDTCSKTEFQIQNSSGTTVYTKELTGATYTATITDANLQRGVLYRIRCRQFGTTLTTPSAWSSFVSFRTADIYIQAPTVISPVTGNQIFKYNVVISGNPFAVVGGGTDTHAASQYRVQNTLGTNIYDSGEKTDALTSITIPELTEAVVGESYKISVRYKGTTYGWSDWATAVTVSIKSAYVNAPVLTAPTQNAQIKGTTVAFVQQGFSSTGTSDTQNGVQYQLLKADNSVYYDSGELTTDYAAHTAEITRPAVEIALRARARNKGTNLGWSAWSEYVNITVSPSLHLTLSEDSTLLYVGKPDGSPFDRTDGTYYWLCVNTTASLPVSASRAATISGFASLSNTGSIAFDTAASGSTTSHNIAELRANPSLIDTHMCSTGSTQDGEYVTTIALAAGVPTKGKVLTQNYFVIGRDIGTNNSLNKYYHMPSKRELLYLVALKDDIDGVMGSNFFSARVASASDYNYCSTFYDNIKIWMVRLSGSTVSCYTTSATSAVTATYNNNVLTLNCDSTGTLLPNKHGVDCSEDTNYVYRGLTANTPLFDHYGHRFWAGIKKGYEYSSMDAAYFDTVISQYTSNKLNDAANNSSVRGNSVGTSVYPFQLYAAGAKSSAWYVTTKSIGVKVGTKDVCYVSPLVNLIAYYINPLVTVLAGFFSGVKTSTNYTPTMSYSVNASNMSYTTTPGRSKPVHHLLCFYEYLPAEKGRKLYRHSSGMGTVMEYTDADGVRKNVVILDSSYRFSSKMSSTNKCPSTLKQLGTYSTHTNLYNILGTADINFSTGEDYPAPDSLINLLWPANLVDSGSSAYNTQQWLTLAPDPNAAIAANNIKVSGVGCQIPNYNVAMRIYLERDALDALDPSVAVDPAKAFGKVNPKGIFGNMGNQLRTSSCMSTNDGYICCVDSNGNSNYATVGASPVGYCPVLELAA